jgi:hypothetical protein
VTTTLSKGDSGDSLDVLERRIRVAEDHGDFSEADACRVSYWRCRARLAEAEVNRLREALGEATQERQG